MAYLHLKELTSVVIIKHLEQLYASMMQKEQILYKINDKISLS